MRDTRRARRATQASGRARSCVRVADSYTTANRACVRPRRPGRRPRPTRRGPTAARRPSRSRAAGPVARDAGAPCAGPGRRQQPAGPRQHGFEAVRSGVAGAAVRGTARPRSRATPSPRASQLGRRAARATRSSPTRRRSACGRTRGAEIFWGPCTGCAAPAVQVDLL